MSRKHVFYEDVLLGDIEEHEFDTEVPEAKNYTEYGLDGLIGANVTLQHNRQTVKAKIMKRSIEPDGKPIDRYNQNPILDSSKYEADLPDEVVYEYYHNILS